MKFKHALRELYCGLRWLLLRPLVVFVRPRPRSGAQRCRILLIRPDRLGDLVMTLPLIMNLDQAYPQARIDILVRPYLAGIAGTIPGIDEVLVYTGAKSAVRAIRQRSYDMVFDLVYDYTLESGLLALFSRAPVRVGFSCGRRGFLFSHPVHVPEKMRGMSAILLEQLRAAGVAVGVRRPMLRVRSKLNVTEDVIALHPGGFFPSQRWPEEKFAGLGKSLLAHYPQVKLLVIGGPAPADKQAVDLIVAGLASGRVQPVFPELEQLAGVLSGCKMLICNNSGPLHLAAAVGIPTVSTLGPTDARLWFPAGEHQRVVTRSLSCSPCSRRVCRRHECLEQISVEEMFGCIKAELKKIYGLT
jgi:lipopolysaccharide heptosyltransferase II